MPFSEMRYLLWNVINAQTLLRLKPFPAVNSGQLSATFGPFIQHLQVNKERSGYGGHMKGCSANVFRDIKLFS